MALKRHETFQIGQSGATNGQLLGWNGTKWLPVDAPSGADGNGIYTGDGTIGAGNSDLAVVAKLQTDAMFQFDYSNVTSNFAIRITDDYNDSPNVSIRSRTNDASIVITDFAGGSSIDLTTPFGITGESRDAGLRVNAPTIISDGGFGDLPDHKALLDLSSTSAVLLLPRLSAANFTAFNSGTLADGLMFYHTDNAVDTIRLRANGAWVDLVHSGNIPTITASNGLTKTGLNIALGGALTQATTITNANTHQLSFTGAKVADFMFVVTNTDVGATSSVISATAAGGTGVYGKSALSGLGGLFTTEASANTTAISALKLTRNVTTGVGAVGNGVKLTFGAETDTTIDTTSTNLVSEWTTVTHATRTSKFSITGVDGGTEANKLEISGNGNVRLNAYGGAGFTGTPTRTLQVDSSGNIIQNTTVAFENTLTFSNGLTRTTNDIKLGGALVDATTTITGDASKYLIVTGARTGGFDASMVVNNTSTGAALKAEASGTGLGIYGKSSTGTAIFGESSTVAVAAHSSGTVGMYSQMTSAAANTVLTGLRLDRITGGTAAVGLGSKILFTNETSSGATLVEANSIVSKWSNATNGAQVAEFSVTGYNVATENTLLTLSGTGAARLNQYGGAGFTGTATKTLQVDSSGNIIQGNFTAGADGNGIYTGSGTIPNNTVATLAAGGDFTIDYSSGTDAFRVDDANQGITLSSEDGNSVIQLFDGALNMLHQSQGLTVTSAESSISNVLNVTKTIAYSTAITPAQITANTNNYAPVGAANAVTWMINTDASRNITGIANPTAGRVIILTNNGAFNIVLKNEDANSTAANRFALIGDLYLQPNMSISLVYDSNAGRWRSTGMTTGGIYTGSGTIAPGATATTTTNSFFRIEYAGGNDAFNLDSTTGAEDLQIRGKSTSSNYAVARFHLDYLNLAYGAAGTGIYLIENEVEIDSKFRLSGVQTPATFGATQNDYDSQNVTHLRLETTVNDTQITGLTHGAGLGNFVDADGRILFITNIGAANQFRLMNNNAGSQSEYRFAGTVIVTAGMTIQLIYDGTSQRWRIVT
jgi:hypothetical protein